MTMMIMFQTKNDTTIKRHTESSSRGRWPFSCFSHSTCSGTVLVGALSFQSKRSSCYRFSFLPRSVQPVTSKHAFDAMWLAEKGFKEVSRWSSRAPKLCQLSDRKVQAIKLLWWSHARLTKNSVKPLMAGACLSLNKIFSSINQVEVVWRICASFRDVMVASLLNKLWQFNDVFSSLEATMCSGAEPRKHFTRFRSG